MRIRIEKVSQGLHPAEIVVRLETRSGREELVVDTQHLEDDTLNIGWPVGREAEYYLIELPTETFRGSWRVWVKKDNLLPDTAPQRMMA